MVSGCFRFVSVNDAAGIQVVRRHFDPDGVARENANEAQTHPARNVGEYAAPIFQLNADF